MPSDQDHSTGYKDRRTARLPVEKTTQMRPQSWYSVEVRIRDLSTCGFMAECDASVRIGSCVSLDVPGLGPIHAQVRWQIGGRMGGMFLDPISLGKCEWTAIRSDPPKEAA